MSTSPLRREKAIEGLVNSGIPRDQAEQMIDRAAFKESELRSIQRLMGGMAGMIAASDVISIIDQHIPSLTDDDEQEMLAMPPPHMLDSDVANFAIRTCHCGVRIDGFYQYTDHLKEMLKQAGVA